MSKHTEGPWEVIEPENGLPVISANHEDIAFIRAPSYAYGPEIKANAKLIAAAPDLLEACEWLLDTLDSDSAIWCAIRPFHGSSEWVKNFRSAIKKAGE